MLNRTRPPLTLPEYERIFRTIHAVVANEDGDSSKACLFFGIAGAFLLSRHHGLKTARPIAGVAGYNLRTPTNLALLLGSAENGVLAATEDAFHCWIDVDGWIVDLTAPLFDAMAPAERKGALIQPLMFQKTATGGSVTLGDLNTSGAYLHVPDYTLTNALMIRFSRMHANSDLVNICAQWYARPPKKMISAIPISNQHGEVTEVRLSNIRVDGAW